MAGPEDGDPSERAPAADPPVGAAPDSLAGTPADSLTGPPVGTPADPPAGTPADPPAGTPADPLVGTPERESAQEALEAHLIAKRIDPGEYERRAEAAKLARTQSELMRLFGDLPVPHPELPPAAVSPAAPEEEPTQLFVSGCLTLALGLPVAVVLGFAYGMWWTLIVPVAVTVTMAYIEHLRTAGQEQAPEDA